MALDPSPVSVLPIPIHDNFDIELRGTYGEFGVGGNVRPFFIQTSIPVGKLEMIKLVNEIPGTERWPIQDLFQRDVDEDRVVSEIIPHFEDVEKVKFFSPLTLTLMPVDGGKVLEHKMPRVVEGEITKDGFQWTTITRGDYYRIRLLVKDKQYAILEWNTANTRLVAIDGQHRLSTLKRLLAKDSESSVPDIQSWKIPVLIASFRAADEKTNPPSIVEVSRQLFTNINTEARTVNPSRQILLNDVRPNSIFAQELIQASHNNDLEHPQERNPAVLPLLFFDWRSNYDGHAEPKFSFEGLKTVTEIHEWSENYLLGKDGSDWNCLANVLDAAGLENEKLAHAITNCSIPLNLSHELRKFIREHLVPPIAYLLENFEPYKNYIDALRKFELDCYSKDKTHAIGHAFDELRYGRNFSLTIERPDIDRVLNEIKEKIPKLKREFIPDFFERAIGMRGVICAFGNLGKRCNSTYDQEYSKAFTRLINSIYADGWLDPTNCQGKGKFVKGIAIDDNSRIINFKHTAIHSALGNYISLLVSVYALSHENLFAWLIEDYELWRSQFDNYRRTVFREYKKVARIIVKDMEEFHFSGKQEIEREIERRARNATNQHVKEFKEELEKVSDYFSEICDYAELCEFIDG